MEYFIEALDPDPSEKTCGLGCENMSHEYYGGILVNLVEGIVQFLHIRHIAESQP
jgi:hypothetical protein